MKKRIFLLLGCAFMLDQPVAWGQHTDYSQIMTLLKNIKTDVAFIKTDVAFIKTDVAFIKTDVALIELLSQNSTRTEKKINHILETLSIHTNLLQKILDMGQTTYATLESLINTKPFWVKAATEYNASKATFLVDCLLRACTGIPQTYTGPVSIALTGGGAVYKKLAFDPWVESASISGYNVGQYIAPHVMSKSWGDLGQEYGLMIGFYCLTQPQVRSTIFQQGKKWIVDPLINGLASLADKGKNLVFSRKWAAEGMDTMRRMSRFCLGHNGDSGFTTEF